MALFTRKKKNNDEIEKQEQTPVQETEISTEGLVKTTLSFHPDWELTNQEKYVYQFKHEQLPLLKPNQISITGTKLIQYNDGFVVVAFLRNTLPKAVRFEAVDLLLLDENGQAIAKKQFELDGLDELPSMACRPWRFLFSNEDKLVEKIPEHGWKIAFELKQSQSKHQLELAESWENQISPLQKEHLEKLVASLPKLSPGEVNFMGIETKYTPEQNLAVTVLIRNGSEKNIMLEQIPLIVEDADGDIVCQGGFKLDQFEVKANTSKPWTFIFPKELVTKEKPNLTKWKVYPPAKQ
ncbi:accessory Sec system S-layer assembly protein [Cytobacillus sp. FJAT-54145]|uniref:Accessory Sec system S-layer assembly protein n=1 Tax=Cytobacillus spartinae TaxID=3299023 RepID=A0ABW6KDS2_9BACI